MPIVEITIPVLNEEGQLEDSIATLDRFLTAQNYKDIAIILGDNGSTDNTGAIAQSLCRSYPWLSYVRRGGARRRPGA